MIFQGATWNDGADNDFGIAFDKKCLFGDKSLLWQARYGGAAEEQINYTEFFIVVLVIVRSSHFIVLD
tara:strand:- start:601 stop:804 length:204 start_codon:yes stop_codon:yes gene_type:complete